MPVKAQKINKQKVKLRTSLDVYHRLIHDSTLPINTNNVLIGYTDGKYVDLQHMPLHEWVLIDRGGDIPMHHIVYFKYKDIILWDKRIRLDRLYGSGNTKSHERLRNILQHNAEHKYNYNDDDTKTLKRSNKLFAYPSNGAITANPRQERVTDSKLTNKGIKSISYVYSFGVIGYKFKTINSKSFPLFLIIQHQKSKKWGFPKGRYETGEHPFGFDTAKREFEEESGISFNDDNIVSIDWVNPYISQYQYKRRDQYIKKCTVFFAAEISSNANATIVRPKEIGDIKWMRLEQFKAKNKHKQSEDIIQKLYTNLMKEEKILDTNTVQAHINIINDTNENNHRMDPEEKQQEIEENALDIDVVEERQIVKELLDELDDVINFLSSKLFEDNNRDESEMNLNEKQQRKKRIKYLMRKKQQNELWNTFKMKYNYNIPTLIELKATFKKELNDLNTSYSQHLNGNIIQFEDIYFIFNTIFSKRKHDINPNTNTRTEQEWNKVFPRYPIDSDQYAVSFAYNDDKQWLPILHKYGFVVISDVLSPQECDKSVSALFEDMNKRNKKHVHIDINNYRTWDNKYWPSPKRKFLTDCPAFNIQAFKNRFNKKIEYVFSKIFNTHELNVSIDNWGIQRPYKIYTKNNACIVNEKWQFSLKPHWDYSPWLFIQEMNKLGFNPGYQGIVALNDHNLESGCHRNLPSGVHYLSEWTKQHVYPYSDKTKYKMYNDDNMVYLRKSEKPKQDDDIIEYMQTIPMRKGDFIIWSWGSLHGNTPNISDKWRFVQYIRMFPAPCVDENYSKHDRYSPQRILNNKRFKEILCSDCFYKDINHFGRMLNLSKREKCLLGMQEW